MNLVHLLPVGKTASSLLEELRARDSKEAAGSLRDPAARSGSDSRLPR